MKIPFYSPKCQSLSSSNKVLINNIGILLKIQKKKKTIQKYQIRIENLIIFIIFVQIKLSFMFYTQRTNEKEYTFFLLCFGVNTSFPFYAK